MIDQNLFFENPLIFWLLIPLTVLIFLELRSRKNPWWLIGIRGIWVLGIIFLIADLQRVVSREWSQSKSIRVLIDRSESVTKIPDRKERTEVFFEELKEWASQADQSIDTFIFSDTLVPNLSNSLGQAPFSEWTSIEGLQNLAPTGGATVVLSDGVLSSPKFGQENVYTVQLGEDSEKDLWIENAPSVLTAFLKNRIDFPVTINQRGFSGKQAEVSLKLGSEIISQKNVTLAEESKLIELSYFPEKMGEEIFTIEIKPIQGEISAINNQTYLRIRTVRDKIRILHISGKPSLYLKSWRLFLTRQPDVDLVSFYILRSLDDDPAAKSHELSLIPFPYEDLFTTELEKFDLVILQNFNFNLYFQAFYLQNLARFVESGGALLMMGGDQSFQNYRFSPLAKLMPFSFNSGEYGSGSYRIELPMKHPITEGLEKSMSAVQWGSRHDVRVKDSSLNLINFSDGIPLLSLSEFGKGRVVALNTDESWRLYFEQPGDFVSFGKLARRLTQWLTFDPEMEAKKISSSSWRIGQPVSLSVSDNQRVDWVVRQKEKIWEFPNQSKIQFKVESAGVYEVSISSLKEVFRFETEEKPWLYEWKNLLSKNDILKEIADSSQGNFYSWENRKNVFHKSLGGQQIIASTTNSWLQMDSLWLWVVLASIILFLCLDFFLRKKFSWDL